MSWLPGMASTGAPKRLMKARALRDVARQNHQIGPLLGGELHQHLDDRRPLGPEMRIRDLQHNAHRVGGSASASAWASQATGLSRYSGVGEIRNSSGASIQVTSPSKAIFICWRPCVRRGFTIMRWNSEALDVVCAA